MINKPALFTFLFSLSAMFCSVSYAGTTAPVTTHTLNPALPNGNNSWYTVPVEVTLTSTDLESGVYQLKYRVDGGVWQTGEYGSTLNLAPNPSFEVPRSGGSWLDQWDVSVVSAHITHSQDTTTYLPGFDTSSGKMVATQGEWHGINNSTNFSAVNPYSHVTTSAWIKTQNLSGMSLYKVYVLSQAPDGSVQTTYMGQSNSLTGNNDWTKLSYSFDANIQNTIGVYMDIGIVGAGTVWADAVDISTSVANSEAKFTVGSDGIHTIEYYAVDRAGNTETTKSFSIKIDQTPPGNWHDSGAIRALQGSDHEMYVYTTVEDVTSGLSSNTDKYNYHVDGENGFGYYENLIYCNTTWHENEWVALGSLPPSDGDPEIQVKTQRTDFCNNNWKICKTVRFYAEDMAGNVSDKDFCINGPWIKIRGEGIVRSNFGINMISEPEENNTDGLIETGEGYISFFSSTLNWEAMFTPSPAEYNYDQISKITSSPTTISGLTTQSGVFLINTNFEAQSSTIPSTYDTSIFAQIVFINGDLKISDDIPTNQNTAALFVVKGKVEIAKSVDEIGVSIICDGDFYTAYDIEEGQHTGTLNLTGLYSANKFIFKRTLQGTNNSKYPSENFTYAPVVLSKLKDYMGSSNIEWRNIE